MSVRSSSRPSVMPRSTHSLQLPLPEEDPRRPWQTVVRGFKMLFSRSKVCNWLRSGPIGIFVIHVLGCRRWFPNNCIRNNTLLRPRCATALSATAQGGRVATACAAASPWRAWRTCGDSAATASLRDPRRRKPPGHRGQRPGRCQRSGGATA
jgi:hypothetical protein